jgi:hypothetical protein
MRIAIVLLLALSASAQAQATKSPDDMTVFQLRAEVRFLRDELNRADAEAKRLRTELAELKKKNFELASASLAAKEKTPQPKAPATQPARTFSSSAPQPEAPRELQPFTVSYDRFKDETTLMDAPSVISLTKGDGTLVTTVGALLRGQKKELVGDACILALTLVGATDANVRSLILLADGKRIQLTAVETDVRFTDNLQTQHSAVFTIPLTDATALSEARVTECQLGSSEFTLPARVRTRFTDLQEAIKVEKAK